MAVCCRLGCWVVVVVLIGGDCCAQAPSSSLPLSGLPRRVLSDQKGLFANPFGARKADLRWIVPTGILTGVLIASDQHTMNVHFRSNALAVSRSDIVSSASLSALAVIPMAMYGLGWMHQNPRLQEGGVLAGEALTDSLILNTALKYSFRRERPDVDQSGGRFFRSGWGADSFPSGHAMASWALASTIAHRYPGWLTQLTVYSLATAASLPRITAEKHFPSDVVVGASLGWLIGREVFNRRHLDWNPVALQAPRVKPAARAAAPPSFYVPEREISRAPRGPVFVPLDSWVYPVLTRLGALGYIPDQASGLRPWTREECLRQLGEAESALTYGIEHFGSASAAEASRLILALRQEFEKGRDSSEFWELESLYARYLGVAGQPLVDGYNFGQTVMNDYGRPVGEGNNVIGGFSTVAASGRVSFYGRGELQHSPPSSSPAGALRPEAGQLEPVLPHATGSVNRFRPLEMYAGVQLGEWALTGGKQELWWGPGESGPLSFSNNAEPFYSFRLTSTSPVHLPGPLRGLGGFRLDLIGGKLSGHQFPPRPLLNGQKITWNVTQDLELGFTRWSLFDGAGIHGFNARSVLRNLLANGPTAAANDPGDRKSGFDFRWRLPVPGRFITLYSDFYADDEPSPLASPRRSAFSPGIYLARLPGLPRWDLRVEAPSTRLAIDDHGGLFLYWNNVYNDANTNQGCLLGNWVGRDGRGLFVQSTYWHSPRTRFVFGYRQNRVGPAFLPGGGTQDCASLAAQVQVKPDWVVSFSTQYERYNIPLLGGPRRNVTTSLEVVYTPHWKLL